MTVNGNSFDAKNTKASARCRRLRKSSRFEHVVARALQITGPLRDSYPHSEYSHRGLFEDARSCDFSPSGNACGDAGTGGRGLRAAEVEGLATDRVRCFLPPPPLLEGSLFSWYGTSEPGLLSVDSVSATLVSDCAVRVSNDSLLCRTIMLPAQRKPTSNPAPVLIALWTRKLCLFLKFSATCRLVIFAVVLFGYPLLISLGGDVAEFCLEQAALQLVGSLPGIWQCLAVYLARAYRYWLMRKIVRPQTSFPARKHKRTTSVWRRFHDLS